MTKRKNTKQKVEKWSSGELMFITLWRQIYPSLPEPEHDVRFHPVRGWRFDFVWQSVKVAVEIEGAVYARGRHTRGSGYEKDCEKYNAALDLDYAVYRFSTTMLEREPYKYIQQVASALLRRTHQTSSQVGVLALVGERSGAGSPAFSAVV
jgi:very-short-patch-repair endonuclease